MMPTSKTDVADRLRVLRSWQTSLDEAFRVPATSIRFGWDAVVGLIPGAGDIVTALFGIVILLHAHQMRIPAIAQVRMVVNLAIDLAIGLVPIAGDIADIFWKANTRNLRLLERHAGPERPPTGADWAFVFGVTAALLAVAALPLVLLMAFLRALGLL
jgi:Domain of unknown function (DUF4112)